jgi:hypothetical protein
MPDYQLPLIGSATLATAVAGGIGTIVAFVAAYGLARSLAPALRERKENAPSKP